MASSNKNYRIYECSGLYQFDSLISLDSNITVNQTQCGMQLNVNTPNYWIQNILVFNSTGTGGLLHNVEIYQQGGANVLNKTNTISSSASLAKGWTVDLRLNQNSSHQVISGECAVVNAQGGTVGDDTISFGQYIDVTNVCELDIVGAAGQGTATFTGFSASLTYQTDNTTLPLNWASPCGSGNCTNPCTGKNYSVTGETSNITYSQPNCPGNTYCSQTASS